MTDDPITAAVHRRQEAERPNLQALVKTYGRWDLIPPEARQRFQIEMEEWKAKVGAATTGREAPPMTDALLMMKEHSAPALSVEFFNTSTRGGRF